MAECYCLGCGKIFEDGEKPRVNEHGEPEMDSDLCPSCREALEVGKRILGLIEEQKAGIEAGREDAMQKMGVKVEATK